jgi:hypothetical protein
MLLQRVASQQRCYDMPYCFASKERGNIVLIFCPQGRTKLLMCINRPLLLRNISFLAGNTGPHDVVSVYVGALCR